MFSSKNEVFTFHLILHFLNYQQKRAKNLTFFLRKSQFKHFFSKNIRVGEKKTKKPLLDMCLNMIFKKSAFLVKFDAKKWILRLITLPKMYTLLYFTVKIQKLQRSINFRNWGLTPLLNFELEQWILVINILSEISLTLLTFIALQIFRTVSICLQGFSLVCDISIT